MKKLFSVCLTLLLLVVLAMPVLATTDLPCVIDDADLLTDYEESQLEAMLDQLGQRFNMDIVIATTDDTGYSTSQSYADDLYDYSGYGSSGILYLIDMDNRKSTISTCGYAITVFTDAGQSYMQDILTPMLSDGDYYGAAEEFALLCEDFCLQAEQGQPYDASTLPEEPFDVLTTVVISLIVGFVIALIATAVMKGQLNNVQPKAGAGDYMKPGSLQLTESRDLFLYRHVDRRAKPKDSGSSTHRSSSGRSHGGSSRSF